jgi:hypothetical protein
MTTLTPVLAVLALAAAGAALVAQARVRPIGVDVLPGSGDAVPALVIAFQRADCGSSTLSLAAWNDFAAQGIVPVAGLLVGAETQSAADSIAAEFDLRFPLSPDRRRRGERFLAGLGYQATPVVVALDGQGRMRYAAQWSPLDGDRLLAESTLIVDGLFEAPAAEVP